MAPAIAGVDRGRGLNDSFLEHFLLGLQQLAESAHNACRKRIAQPKGMSDREDFLTDFQFV